MPFDLLASRNYINDISIYENQKVIHSIKIYNIHKLIRNY